VKKRLLVDPEVEQRAKNGILVKKIKNIKMNKKNHSRLSSDFGICSLHDFSHHSDLCNDQRKHSIVQISYIFINKILLKYKRFREMKEPLARRSGVLEQNAKNGKA
jgi:hypothetical protein